MLLKPFSTISTSVASVTGGLFQDPSSGTASSVFPRLQPGFNPANAADAVIGVNVAVHACEEVLLAVLVEDGKHVVVPPRSDDVDELVVVLVEDGKHVVVPPSPEDVDELVVILEVVFTVVEVLLTDEELVVELLAAPGRH